MTFRDKLQSQPFNLGIFCKTSDSAFIEAAGLAGLDFAILDREHGPADWQTIQHHVRAAQISGLAPVVRVEGLDPHAIGTAFDLGAEGVQIPNISTPEEAEIAVKAARFHPMGSRGVCRFVNAARYGSKDKAAYFADENQKTLILQVEGQEGIGNLDAILDVEGFDVLFVGPYDLSQSVGKPGDITSPEVTEAIQSTATAARAKGKAFGVFCDTPELLAAYKQQEVDYIAHSVDVSLFRDAVNALING